MPVAQHLATSLSGLLWLLGTALWVWMLVDCIRRDPDRGLWLWLLILFNFAGALIYFFVRYLPRASVRPPSFLGRWVRRREVLRAEADVRHIGNAYQYVTLGDVLRETGQLARAADAYAQAIAKEPDSAQALWGAASVEMQLGRFEEAKAHLAALMAIDPDYKLGDASLAYGRALLELGELDAARAHLEGHIQRRGDPQANVLLAAVHAERGEPQAARDLLEPLIEDLKPARDPTSRRARSDAARLLRKLPR